MTRPSLHRLGILGLAALILGLGCGGGSSALTPPATHSGTVGLMATDATTETWSEVGIIIRKASLVLQSDTAAASPVVIYDGSADTTQVNLLQLDQINDLLAQTAGVPAGTYDRVILEVDGSPANITLVPAVDATGVTPAAIDTSLIVVKGTADASHPTWKVLPTITLSAPIVVTSGSASALAVDFDLAHPAFIVEHDVTSATGVTQTLYVVNFGTKGIFRHKAAASLDKYYLRRHRGTVAAVAADSASFTLTTEHGQTLTIDLDKGTSPTVLYNLDASPVTALATNVVPATVTAGVALECTARYQADGSLVAVRAWYSATASSLPSWNVEGHITKVDAASTVKTINVLASHGDPRTFAITTATRWFFHGDTATDLSGGDGVAFLANVDRFFKVHVTVADPTPAVPVAATVDIQRGVFEGSITSASTTGFTYAKTFADLTSSTHTLGYEGSTFSYWDFTFPGTASTSLPGFVAEATAGIGAGSTFKPYGVSTLNWAGGTTAWNANNTVLMPVQISTLAQTVTAGYDGTSMTVQTRLLVSVNVTLDASSTTEQPTVTLITKQAGSVVTIAGLDASQWAAALSQGAKVRVYGVPDGSGNLKAYYVNIYQ